MSRSGYTDEIDNTWDHVMWRGAVKSAINGGRGQLFLLEMLAALDALPEKRLVSGALEEDGEFCAIGSVGRRRGLDMSGIKVEDHHAVAKVFGIADAMAREIAYENDEYYYYNQETPEQRFARMRAWVVSKIKIGEVT